MTAVHLTAPGIDPQEVAYFERLAHRWWDAEGPFWPLHRLNSFRVDYVRVKVAQALGRDPQQVQPLAGLRVLDIGCGGGILSESVARLGAQVVGTDVTEKNLGVARLHAQWGGLSIDYRLATAAELVQAGESFDLVLNMEVVEHVADPAAFVKTCRDLLKPGGLMICSTLNRNAKSFAMAIVGAEWVMRWLPKGTHDWSKFITPDELYGMLRGAGLEPVDRKGMVFSPLGWSWSLSDRDLSCNYVTASLRPKAD